MWNKYVYFYNLFLKQHFFPRSSFLLYWQTLTLSRIQCKRKKSFHWSSSFYSSSLKFKVRINFATGVIHGSHGQTFLSTMYIDQRYTMLLLIILNDSEMVKTTAFAMKCKIWLKNRLVASVNIFSSNCIYVFDASWTFLVESTSSKVVETFGHSANRHRFLSQESSDSHVQCRTLQLYSTYIFPTRQSISPRSRYRKRAFRK